MSDLTLDDVIQEARRESERAKDRVLHASRLVRHTIDHVDRCMEGGRIFQLNELDVLRGAGVSLDVAIGRLIDTESHQRLLEQLAASLHSKE